MAKYKKKSKNICKKTMIPAFERTPSLNNPLSYSYMHRLKPRCQLQYSAMFYTYIATMVGIWMWLGWMLVTAGGSRVHVPCAVIYIDGIEHLRMERYDILADFQQLNTTRTTGNVTVLDNGNLTEAVAAVREFAVSTRHTCVYAKNRRKLYYESMAPPDSTRAAMVISGGAFVMLGAIIVLCILNARSFRKPTSIIASHTYPGDANSVELIQIKDDPEGSEGDDFKSAGTGTYTEDDEIIVFNNPSDKKTSTNSAVIDL